MGGLGKNDTQGLEAELKAKAAELEKMKLKNFQLEQQVRTQLLTISEVIVAFQYYLAGTEPHQSS